jgi:hypothetical protein
MPVCPLCGLLVVAGQQQFDHAQTYHADVYGHLQERERKDARVQPGTTATPKPAQVQNQGKPSPVRDGVVYALRYLATADGMVPCDASTAIAIGAASRQLLTTRAGSIATSPTGFGRTRDFSPVRHLDFTKRMLSSCALPSPVAAGSITSSRTPQKKEIAICSPSEATRVLRDTLEYPILILAATQTATSRYGIKRLLSDIREGRALGTTDARISWTRRVSLGKLSADKLNCRWPSGPRQYDVFLHPSPPPLLSEVRLPPEHTMLRDLDPTAVPLGLCTRLFTYSEAGYMTRVCINELGSTQTVVCNEGGCLYFLMPVFPTLDRSELRTLVGSADGSEYVAVHIRPGDTLVIPPFFVYATYFLDDTLTTCYFSLDTRLLYPATAQYVIQRCLTDQIDPAEMQSVHGVLSKLYDKHGRGLASLPPPLSAMYTSTDAIKVLLKVSTTRQFPYGTVLTYVEIGRGL